MNTPSPSVYFDAPAIATPPLDMPEKTTTATSGGDVKHSPNESTPADTSPQYDHKDGATHPEKPTVNTNVTGGPTVQSPVNAAHTASPGSTERVMTSHERAATAESSMSTEAKLKLAKSEGKDAKIVSKVLKEEGRADTSLLKTAIKELQRLQKVQKQVSKEEAAALSAHSKAIKLEHKLNMQFLAARAKHEAAVAELKAREDALSATKEHLKRQVEILKEKEAEVTEMREKKAVDDREREAKLKQLTMSPIAETS